VTRTLLVTNDYPPKVGGIQNYLEELWTRLDPASTMILTASSDPRARQYDEEQARAGLVITRVRRSTIYVPDLAARAAVDRAIDTFRPGLVLYDPFVPLGMIGARQGIPYGVVLHGAEVAIPSRLPVLRRASASVLRGASVVLCAGGYPESEARRLVGADLPAVVQIPPGVDAGRFVPLAETAKSAVRARLGLPSVGPIVTSVGRLVPRKGLDVLIEAVALASRTDPTVTLVIAGDGRDRSRLQRIARRAAARVHFLGRIGEREKIDLLGASDVFAQPCRSRWGGLEQEGFGIVFLEAAACGIPQVAGRSGGSFEAVDDGVTGLVVDRPGDPAAVAAALVSLLEDPARRRAMGAAGRDRAAAQFSYDGLASRLAEGLDAVLNDPTPPTS
jgi:phosphatidylinositol alpha-1,6-mannosyltransferase